MGFEHVIPQFVVRLKRLAAQHPTGRLPFEIQGDGSQTRSFTFVSDLVAGIIALLESHVVEPVNIGNPHEVTIEEIARTIIALVNSKSQIVYRPLPTDDPKQRRPDITRARTLLGWEPKVGLQEGLLATVDYFKKKINE